MKWITEYLSAKVAKPSIIKATDKTIHQIVKSELDRLGHDGDLNHIDVSQVTNMDSLFSSHIVDLGPKYIDLNPDISQWNVSMVKNMCCIFCYCENFNCDISNWDVSNVTIMNGMFFKCKNFNCDISGWNINKVFDMRHMFEDCKNFYQDLSGWDVKNAKYHGSMFSGCPIKEEYKPKFN